MGSPSDLSLHYRPHEYPPAPAKKLEEFLARLEDERRKIEAFQRELPLSMDLLNNAVDVYRRQLHIYRGTAPVFEEFMPLKNGGAAPDSPEARPEMADDAFPDKAGWMSSTQLWCPADGGGGAIRAQPPPEDTVDRPPFNNTATTAKAVLPDANRQRPGGAFVPELALATAEEPETKLPAETAPVTEGEGCAKGPLDQGKAAAAEDGGRSATVPCNRKARRCWTPDLHRRFVNALQMLGGSQVATPKQIRELMKVDGLTNDEVKSHLQKYRLHTRRPIPAPPSAAPAAAATAQLLVLGGIWVPPEYATAAAAAGPVIYSGHPGAHFCPAQTVQQDYYSTAAALRSPHYQPPPPPRHHDGMPAASGTAAPARASFQVKDESPEAEERGRQLVETTSESVGEGEEKAPVEGDDEVEEDEEEGRRSESSSCKGGDEQAEKATGEHSDGGRRSEQELAPPRM